MKNKTKEVIILPLSLSENSSSPVVRTTKRPSPKPSINDFIKSNPDITNNTSSKIIGIVYKSIYLQFQSPQKTTIKMNELLKKITLQLYTKNLWTWSLDIIVEKCVRYLKYFGESSVPINEITEELRDEFRNILTNNGFFSSFLLETIVEQIIKEFKASSPQTSIEKITTRLQKNAILKKMPSKVISSCVDNFFALLFRKGYLTFSD